MSRICLLLLPVVLALPSNTTQQGPPSGLVPFNASEALVRHTVWQNLMLTPDSPATCTNDMRKKMPSCSQLGNMWCWATGVSALTEFYTGSGPGQCRGLECQIVGWCPKPPHCSSQPHTQCCPYSQHQSDCGNDGASHDMIVEAATHFTGKQHVSQGGALSQEALDKTLQAGKPVLMLIGPGTSATHQQYLRGCGDGKYYFWDPEWGTTHNGHVEPVYPTGSDKRSYKELLSYTYPTGYKVNWLDTVYAK